ncbi:MerR family transcriptional regulator [Microbacterium sp. HJ5]
MKIGELSERTGIPTRMLRYYEQQELLDSERSANGYRSYDEAHVERAARVRGLIQSGLSTRMTKVVLDLERQCALETPPVCTRALAEELAQELVALEERLACLTRSRDAVALYLERSAHGDLVPSENRLRRPA